MSRFPFLEIVDIGMAIRPMKTQSRTQTGYTRASSVAYQDNGFRGRLRGRGSPAILRYQAPQDQ